MQIALRLRLSFSIFVFQVWYISNTFCKLLPNFGKLEVSLFHEFVFLLLLHLTREQRSNDRKYVCCSQASLHSDQICSKHFTSSHTASLGNYVNHLGSKVTLKILSWISNFSCTLKRFNSWSCRIVSANVCSGAKCFQRKEAHLLRIMNR